MYEHALTIASLFAGVSLDIFDPDPDGTYHGRFPNFPYNELQFADNIEMTRLCANLGHDLHNIPGFKPLVLNSYSYLQLDSKPTHTMMTEFLTPLLPSLHEGLVQLFTSYREMAEGSLTMQPVDFTTLCRIVDAEAQCRAWNPFLNTFRHDNRVFHPSPEGLTHLNTTHWQESVEIDTDIEDGLVLRGDAAVLHLLLYQLIKNSVGLLTMEHHHISKARLLLSAKNIRIHDADAVAVMVEDNGPGIDISAILRAKQRLIDPNDASLTYVERLAAGDWTALDLRILDVVNFIFEQRVSGAERGTQHSGIGLAMAKQIIDEHGGSIWATNRSASPKEPDRQGAKFLVILDPSNEGVLRDEAPELFQTDTPPTALLNDIDSAMRDKAI